MAERGGNWANNRFGFRRFLIRRSGVRIPLGAPFFYGVYDDNDCIVLYFLYLFGGVRNILAVADG